MFSLGLIKQTVYVMARSFPLCLRYCVVKYSDALVLQARATWRPLFHHEEMIPLDRLDTYRLNQQEQVRRVRQALELESAACLFHSGPEGGQA